MPRARRAQSGDPLAQRAESLEETRTPVPVVVPLQEVKVRPQSAEPETAPVPDTKTSRPSLRVQVKVRV